MKEKVITLYTLKDADELLKRRRRNKRIQIFNFIVDKLDKAACAIIVPVVIAGLIYIFIF